MKTKSFVYNRRTLVLAVLLGAPLAHAGSMGGKMSSLFDYYITPNYNISSGINYISGLNTSLGSFSGFTDYTLTPTLQQSVGSSFDSFYGLGSSSSIDWSSTWSSTLNNNNYDQYKLGFNAASTYAQTGLGYISSGLAISDPVNAMTGEFYQDDTDLTLTGPTPIVIKRSYISSSLIYAEFGAGWRMNNDSSLFVNKAIVEMASGSCLPTNAEVRLGENDGTVLVYSRMADTPADVLRVNENPDASDTNDGLNNFNAYGVGGRSNLKNNYIKYEPATSNFTAYAASGTERVFEWRAFTSGTNTFRRPYLKYEKRPDGNKIIYEYSAAGLPNYIKATSGDTNTVYNWIKFEFNSYDQITALVAKDGRRVSYYYDRFGDLIRMVRPDHTEVCYQYEPERDSNGFVIGSTHRLIRIDKPEGRCLINEYYQVGDVVEGSTISSNDYRIGRVKLQKAPVDEGVSLVVNALFVYNENTTTNDADFGSGETRVYDINGNLITYAYNAEKQLTATRHYQKNGSGDAQPVADILSLPAGHLTRHTWTNIPGKPVTNLTLNATFPQYPDVVATVSNIDITVNSGNNYGQKIFGFIHPPTNGSYTFWIASDECSELWLSTDELVSHKQKIASVSNATTSVHQWTKDSSQHSVAVSLEAGKKYYIEVLHKENSDADHVEIAWKKPGDSSTNVIPSSCFSPYSENTAYVQTPAVTGNYTLYSSGLRYYDSDGNMAAQTTEDAAGNVQSCWTADYDTFGNVLTNTTWGNLTGNCTNYPALNSSGMVTNTTESTVTTYTYSTNNLKLSETAPNGTVVRYVYDETTQNLTAKYVCEPDGNGNPQDNPVYSREFYEYNPRGVRTNSITDNGTSTNKTDLTGVTQRTRVESVPGAVWPTFSLPVTTAAKYWDGGTGWITLNSAQISYNNQGWPVSTAAYDHNGARLYSTSAEYDAMGRILRAVDPFGNVTVNTYDANGNLRKTDGPRTDMPDIVETQYDRFDRPVKTTRHMDWNTSISETVEYDGYGNVMARVDSFGNRTENTYDDLNRLKTMTLPGVKDKNGATYNPVQTVNQYDIFDRPVKTTDANGGTNTVQYNSRGQKIYEEQPDQTWVKYRYNLDGTLARQTASVGNYTELGYDFLGRVTNTLNYSSSDQLLSQTSATYDAFKALTATDAKGNTSTNQYDAAGRLHFEIGPDENGVQSKTKTIYDDFNRVLETRTWFGSSETTDFISTTNTCDFAGRVLSSEVRESDGTLRSKTVNTYDAAGNVITVTAYGQTLNHPSVTRYEYNALGQAVKKTNAAGQETVAGIDYSGSLNPVGPRITVADANGNKTIVHQDALGRTVYTEQQNSANSALHKTDSFYDALGKLVKSTEHIYSNGTESRQVSNTWAYNSVGQPVNMTRSAGSGIERTRNYFYDEFGRLSRTRLPTGVQLFRTYNDRQQLTHLISSDGTVHYEYSYDLSGNLLTATDHINGVNSAFTYDANGRQSSESTAVDGNTIPVQYAFDRAGRLARTLLPGQNAVDYTYTAAGLYEVKRMQGVTSLGSAGGTESYKHTYASRDLAGRLLSVHMDIPSFAPKSFTNTYDSLGRLSTVTAPGWANTVAASGGYDAVGNLLKHTVTDPVGTLSYTNGYSDLYQLTNHQSAVANQQFSYDSIGNRLTGPSAFNLSSMDYTYDALNEITVAKKTGNITNGMVTVPVDGIIQPNPNTAVAISSVTVKLDSGTPVAAVRINEEWNVTGGIAVPANGSNHILTVTATDAAGKTNTQTVTVNIDSASSKAYIYDLNGNLLQQTVYLASGAVETTTCKYDALERLTSVESLVQGQKSKVTYRYDALHRRVNQDVYEWNSSQSLWSKASGLYFLWTGQSEIGAFDSALALTQLRILGEGMGNEIGAAVAVELGANRYIPVHDQRGSVAVLLNSDGTVAESYRYDAYGNVKVYDSTQSEIGNHQSAIGNPWLFSSKRLDKETGLYCFGRRFYDPTLGRFVTADPSGFADGPNLYAYCSADPVNLIDPDGQLSKSYSSSSSIFDSGWTVPDYERTAYQSAGMSMVNQSGNSYNFSDSSMNSAITRGLMTDLQSQGYTTYRNTLDTQSGQISSSLFNSGHELGGAQVMGMGLGLPGGAGVFALGVGQDILSTSISHSSLSSSQQHVAQVAMLALTFRSSGSTFSGQKGLIAPWISGGSAKSVAPTVEQYTLRAVDSGFYPIMTRGSKAPTGITWLEKGDVWKFGTTKNPTTRYSDSFLRNTGDNGLRYSTEWQGTLAEALQLERMKIQNFQFQNGATLPAGNKIVR